MVCKIVIGLLLLDYLLVVFVGFTLIHSCSDVVNVSRVKVFGNAWSGCLGQYDSEQFSK
jgi:hypothetical protein